MWIIGDIHGCLDELELLLDRIPRKDRLIFIGDYIDRGPDSAGVVERALEERDRSRYLLGNHESMMLAYYDDPDSREGLAWTFWGNGGQATLRSYGLTEDAEFTDLPRAHQEFYRNLELAIEEDSFIAVHAGVRITSPNTPLLDQDRDDLLWIREEWIRKEHLWNGKTIYYGHTPSRYVLGANRQTEPIPGQKSLGIDTGCVFGGALTAVNVRTRELIQAPARRAYI